MGKKYIHDIVKLEIFHNSEIKKKKKKKILKFKGMNSIFTDIDLTKGTKQVKTPFVGFLIYSFIFIFQIVTSIVYFLILYWQH